MNPPITSIISSCLSRLLVAVCFAGAVPHVTAGEIWGTVYLDEGLTKAADSGQVKVRVVNGHDEPLDTQINANGTYLIKFPAWKQVTIAATRGKETATVITLLTMDQERKEKSLRLYPKSTTLTSTWVVIGNTIGREQPMMAEVVVQDLYDQKVPAADVYAFIAGVKQVRTKAFPMLTSEVTTDYSRVIPTAWAIHNTEMAIQKERRLWTKAEIATKFGLNLSDKEYSDIMGFAAGFSAKISVEELTGQVTKQLNPSFVPAVKTTAQKAAAVISPQ